MSEEQKVPRWAQLRIFRAISKNYRGLDLSGFGLLDAEQIKFPESIFELKTLPNLVLLAMK